MTVRTDYCETCSRPIAQHHEREWRRHPVWSGGRSRYCGPFCKSLAPDQNGARNAVVFYLRYVKGLTTAQIAQMYATSRQNIEYALRRKG